MEEEKGFIRVRPGENPPIEPEESNIFVDNRPLSLSEGLQYTENTIEVLERSKAAYELLSEDFSSTPAGEVLAKEKRIESEFEQLIAQAEAKEPGSAYPPEPTDEEKKAFSAPGEDE